MREPLLPAGAVDEALRRSAASDQHELAGWSVVDGQLVSTFVCPGFRAALAFVNAVGDLAEEADHHPDIDIRWNRVTLRLVTHDSGGLTRLDLDLARAVRVLADATLPGPGS